MKLAWHPDCLPAMGSLLYLTLPSQFLVCEVEIVTPFLETSDRLKHKLLGQVFRVHTCSTNFSFIPCPLLIMTVTVCDYNLLNYKAQSPFKWEKDLGNPKLRVSHIRKGVLTMHRMSTLAPSYLNMTQLLSYEIFFTSILNFQWIISSYADPAACLCTFGFWFHIALP